MGEHNLSGKATFFFSGRNSWEVAAQGVALFVDFLAQRWGTEVAHVGSSHSSVRWASHCTPSWSLCPRHWPGAQEGNESR